MNDFSRQRVGRWAGFDDLPTSDELALARSMLAAFEPAEELQWRHREDDTRRDLDDGPGREVRLESSQHQARSDRRRQSRLELDPSHRPGTDGRQHQTNGEREEDVDHASPRWLGGLSNDADPAAASASGVVKVACEKPIARWF